jgi:hypothetical protein
LGLVQVIKYPEAKDDKLFSEFLTTLKVKFPEEMSALQVKRKYLNKLAGASIYTKTPWL